MSEGGEEVYILGMPEGGEATYVLWLEVTGPQPLSVLGFSIHCSFKHSLQQFLLCNSEFRFLSLQMSCSSSLMSCSQLAYCHSCSPGSSVPTSPTGEVAITFIPYMHPLDMHPLQPEISIATSSLY